MADEKVDITPVQPTCPPSDDAPPQYTPTLQQPAGEVHKAPSGEIPTQSVENAPQQGVNPTPPQGVALAPQGVTYVPEAGPYSTAGGAYVPQTAVYPATTPQVQTPATPMILRADGATPPPDNLVFAIIVTIFCCFILGIIAIVKSMDSRKFWQMGDEAAARQAAQQSKRLSIIGLVIGLIIEVILIILIVLLFVLWF